MTWRSGRCRALDTSGFDILMAGRMCMYSNKSPFLSRNEWENIPYYGLCYVIFFYFFFISNAFPYIVIIILSAADTKSPFSFLRLISGLGFVSCKTPKGIGIHNITFRKLFARRRRRRRNSGLGIAYRCVARLYNNIILCLQSGLLSPPNKQDDGLTFSLRSTAY